ncbi:glycosyl transferase [Kaistia sp. 32K]|uniref:glycosyltransferase family 4 protein n=1 Tax=Kaistia sp. 32K TaxID=2795690 RepID=UPI001915FA97|nr:glycosyltransferase family 4 protein [Kaistia sp. 32K]BCP53926.1 glycosyl transferase [Kaistia sp. 32K]
MRIAFVLSGFGAGGAEKVVNLLAHHRQSQGDTVHVLAVNAGDPASYFPYDPGIELSTLGGSGNGAGRVSGTGRRILALRRRLAELAPDLVVSFLTKVNVMTGLATLGLDVPIVLSERNNFLSQAKSPLWRLAGPIAGRRAARLVMQTKEACLALPFSLQSRAIVIPNPVASMRAARPSDGSRIVAVGRLEKQKGFDLLLEAFAQVAARLPAARLTIFGEGPERGALEKQARDLGVADRVHMPGVTRSPGDWVVEGDIFVLSSRFEGFPNVLLEAMAAGLAVIAFDCPWGPSEILDNPDAGLLVPAGDVGRLADAMARLATDSDLRQRLAATGAAEAAARYSLPSVLALWDAVIAVAVTAPAAVPA